MVVVDSSCAAARGCGERKRAATEQGSDIDTGATAELQWRAALAVDWKSWEGMKLKAVEIVARIQGDVDQGVVPLLKMVDRRQYGQLLKRLVPSGMVREALLWVMSVEYGVQVEGLREQLNSCVLPVLTSVEELRDQIGGLELAEEQLSETARVVRGWLIARDQQAGNRTALFWFDGWAAKARKVATDGVGAGAGGGGFEAARAQAQTGCADGLAADCSAVLGTGGSEEDMQGSGSGSGHHYK